MVVAIIVASVVLIALLVAAAAVLLRPGPDLPAPPRIIIEPGSFAALATAKQEAHSPSLEAADGAPVAASASPRSPGSDLVSAGTADWANLGPQVIRGLTQLAQAHVRAFWDLSASIDIGRVKVSSEGFAQSLSLLAVQLHAAPSEAHADDGTHDGLTLGVGGVRHETRRLAGFDPAQGADLGAAHAATVDVKVLHASADIDAHGVVGDAAGDPLSAIVHAVPVGTVLVTAFRESKLLRRDDTDLGRAAKNVGIDAVGVAAGAKAGGIAGFAVAGPGGAVVGSVLGALPGKYLASRAKARPLDKARKELELAQESYREAEARISEQITGEWERSRKAITADYRRSLKARRDQVVRLPGELATTIAQDALLGADDVARLLDAGEHHLAEIERSAELAVAQALQSRRLRRGHAKRAALRRLRSDTSAWRAAAAALRKEEQPTLATTERVFDTLLALPDNGEPAAEHVRLVRRARGEALTRLSDVVKRLPNEFTAVRRAAIKALKKRLSEFKRRVAELMEPHYAAVEAAHEKYQTELRMAGGKPVAT